MRIILVNQYYEPDCAPTARYLGDLARALCSRGHDVQIACSRRGYDGRRHPVRHETIEGVTVHRLPAFGFGRATHLGRMLDYASFYLLVAFHLLALRPRPAAIVSLTTPPFLGVPVALAAIWRRCVHIHWCMDVYPDAMLAHGMLGAGSVSARLLVRVSRFMLSHSASVISLGPDMCRALARRSPAASRIECVPLWVPASTDLRPPQDRVAALRQHRHWEDGTVVFLYSGNLGLGHRIEEFLQAVRLCRVQPRRGDMPIRVAFAGGGRRRAVVESFIHEFPDEPVELLPYATADSLGAHLRSADVLLLSLDSAWKGCLLPSKIQTAFSSGRPVLFVGPADSTPGRWIAESGGGWVVAPDDVEGLVVVMRACMNVAERERRAARAIAFASKHFDATANLGRMCYLIESSVAGENAATSGAHR